LILCWWRWE